MALKKIYIARHGYRSNWLAPPHPDPPTGVDSDHPLAEHGEHQAVELAHYIQSLDDKPQMIFSSPFYRCIQTSQCMSRFLGLPICVEKGIGEWFTLQRPVHPVPASVEELSNFFDNLNRDYPADQFVVPSKDGEDEETVFARCTTFLSKFIPYMAANFPEIETVILVTHAATKIALGMALMGYSSPRDLLKPEHVLQGNKKLRAGACSLDRFEFDGTNWNVTMNGNVEFLSAGEEMNWNFENGFEAGSDEDIKARQKAAQLAKDKEDFDEVYVTVDIPTNQQLSSTSSQYYNKILVEDLQPNSKELEKRDTASARVSNKNNFFANLYNSSSLQVSGLETEKPFVLINQQLYQGEYRKLNGTELIFNDNGDVMAKTKDRILLHKGDFESDPKPASSNDQELNDQIMAELPENLRKSNNSNLISKLVMAKKVNLSEK